MGFPQSRTPVLLLAIAALCIIVARACLQSITIDEATSFLSYSATTWPSHWWPISDNHVLNSWLMRLSASIFGVNNLSARLPAILGALIYIVSASQLSLLLAERPLVQILLLACLLFNPMILDYLVAARGYSLAVGFFLAAVAVIAGTIVRPERERTRLLNKCAEVSVLLALSCAANFSFAIANGTTLLLFSVWAARQSRFPRRSSMRLAAAAWLPGLLLGFTLCGSVIWNWPKGELYFGSKDMPEMLRGLANGSFDQLNPNLINPLLIRALSRIHSLGPWLFAFAGLILLGHVEMAQRRKPDPTLSGLANFIRLAALISAVTLVLHWFLYRIFHIPLPKDRTGLFIVPLWTLLFAGSLTFALRNRSSRIVRWPALTVLAITAFYFAGCLRLGYFREWKFDSDTKTLYWMMADLHHRCGIEKFGIDWRYHLPLNFYRQNYGPSGLKEFSGSTSGELPADRDAYAIFFATSQDFIRQQKLQVIYHNDDSGSAVAIRGCNSRQ